MKYGIAGALALAGVTAALIAALPASGSPAGEQTFKIVEKGAGTFKVIDNPPRNLQKRGPSVGDNAIFSRSLYDESNKKVGELSASCTFVPPGRDTLSCLGSFKLKTGTLYGTATIKGEALRTEIAVIGGTGAYEGARGDVTSVARSHKDNAPNDDTVHLMP